MPRLLLILLAALWLWPGALSAQESARPGQALLQRLQKLVDNLKTMEADFVQQVEGNGTDESRGHFAAQRPGRFRWDYRAPNEQLIVSDGTVVWYYEPDLKQATRTGVERIRETPAGFFVSGGPIGDTFHWQPLADSIWPGPAMRLRPRQEGAIQEIIIALDPDKDRMLGLEVLDHLGHRSRIFFDNQVINRPLSADRFRFEPPAGVDVVEDPQGGP